MPRPKSMEISMMPQMRLMDRQMVIPRLRFSLNGIGNVETRFYASFTTLFAPPPFPDEDASVTVFEKVAGVKAVKVPKFKVIH
mmetsp:Transcript_10662/g.15963  ORF Transcript_10662/g.15963 Transcript_10662/m.15963 type:complete len:83 (-) Transcript_10662:181-429(-)